MKTFDSGTEARKILISVIMPNFNTATHISSAIHSVLQQSERRFELIVIDDGSTDGSREVIEQIAAKDDRVRPEYLEGNSGAAVARNVGIRLARGRYIAFLDSDDAWLPNKLERQLALISSVSSGFVYSSYTRVDEAGRDLGTVVAESFVTYRDLLKSKPVGCLTVMFDTQVHGKVLMPLIRARQDLGLWLKLLRHSAGGHGDREVLAVYRVRKSSLSSNKLRAAWYTWRLFRDEERLGLVSAGYYFSHYATYRVLARLRWRLNK